MELYHIRFYQGYFIDAKSLLDPSCLMIDVQYANQLIYLQRIISVRINVQHTT